MGKSAYIAKIIRKNGLTKTSKIIVYPLIYWCIHKCGPISRIKFISAEYKKLRRCHNYNIFEFLTFNGQLFAKIDLSTVKFGNTCCTSFLTLTNKFQHFWNSKYFDATVTVWCGANVQSFILFLRQNSHSIIISTCILNY